MTLEIKEEGPSKDVIEFIRDDENVLVHINGKHVATFYANGSFRFYGPADFARYDGVWNR